MTTKFDTRTLSRYAWIAGAVWTLILVTSLAWDFFLHGRHVQDVARQTAIAYVNKTQAIRKWAFSHGGVYVPESDEVEPSPWLEHVPERDVTTPSGRQLTLINSAHIIREINERFAELFGIGGHFTSLRPLREENAPDAWERKALLAFEAGSAQMSEQVSINGQPYMRLMQPIVVKPRCLGCHRSQGYTVGGIGGGISVTVPMADFLASAVHHDLITGTLHGVYWLLGIGTIVTITLSARVRLRERERVDAELRKAHEYNRGVIEALGEGLCGVDREGRVIFLNAKGESLLGWRERDLVGQNMHDAIHHACRDGTTVSADECPLLAKLRAGQALQSEDQVFSTKDGREIPVSCIATPIEEDGAVVGSVIAFQDITQRKRSEEKIHYLAHHDGLTGLPNRSMLMEFLHHHMSRVSRYDGALALMFIDLDDFSVINDSQGHVTGDKLLVLVANRLRDEIREPDILARHGGDEFIVLLTQPGMQKSKTASVVEAVSLTAADIAERLLRALERPLEIEGQEYFVHGSIGISVFPEDATDAVTLLKNADTAMYHAKEHGGNRYALFAGELSRRFERLHQLENDLHVALQRDEFLLHYQPLVELKTRRIVAVEALIRWRKNGPGEQIVSPAEFIPIAERNGLIVPIGRWVFTEACRQLAAWRAAGHDLYVAVNLSVRQFMRGDLAADLRRIAADSGIEPGSIELEVTEGATMMDALSAEELLNGLSSSGFRLALDDFGTGYSSLSRLKRLPVNTLKIDKYFINGIPGDKDDLEIVLSTIQLARNLGKLPLAEGIEREDQWCLLRDLGCELGQGYYFSPPVAAQEVARLLD
jgi:diguanylate cyclase (GGDEF)-like protein/PAS domain S-box-containing protein